jgi:hypothetical protein
MRSVTPVSGPPWLFKLMTLMRLVWPTQQQHQATAAPLPPFPALSQGRGSVRSVAPVSGPPWRIRPGRVRGVRCSTECRSAVYLPQQRKCYLKAEGAAAAVSTRASLRENFHLVSCACCVLCAVLPLSLCCPYQWPTLVNLRCTCRGRGNAISRRKERLQL